MRRPAGRREQVPHEDRLGVAQDALVDRIEGHFRLKNGQNTTELHTAMHYDNLKQVKCHRLSRRGAYVHSG